jgi:23S rRNA-/tRNA-specific pseudouridylate synthase
LGAAADCALLGDEKYGSRIALPGGAIALHHARMEIAHPVSKKSMSMEAAYPVGGTW